MTTVLIADDQALVRRGFRLILEIEPDLEVVGEAVDGATAVAACRELRPDVVLMDVRMRGRTGSPPLPRSPRTSTAPAPRRHADDLRHGRVRV